MGLTRLSIERPLTVLMGILGVVLMGAVAYTYLKVDRLPPISFPFVSVTVSYPQAAAQDVEELVTKPVENALSGLAGASSISSTSSEGRSVVRVQFDEGVDATLAALDVERRVARIRSRLPSDAGEPSVQKADPNEFPVMNVALTGAPLDQLFDLAVNQIQPQLQSVLGVASVNISGGLQRELQVKVDYAKLAAYNVSVQQVSSALASANVTAPVGTLQQSGQLLNLRSIGHFESASELQNLVIAQTAGGPVLLRDVATVAEGYREQRQLQRLDGQEAVGISIVKASDANALQVADEVRERLQRAEATLPEGASIRVRNDTSVYTRSSLDAVQHDLILAVLLVGLVTLLFLHSLRNVVIILLAVPTSMVSTFLFMYFMGFSLNLMTLMALALMVGILVDASIVVIENIHRHLRQGDEPRKAALLGRNEIAMATIAIALADVVVYVPIAFMSGAIGQLFRQYGLTIVAATLFSLLVSFTLTPLLASRWLAREGGSSGLLGRFGVWWDARFDLLARGVECAVPHMVRARWLVTGAGLLLVVASVALIQLRFIGTEYAPQEDDNTVQVTVTTPPGTSLQVIDSAARQVEEALGDIPEVQSVFNSVSAGGGFGGAGGRASMTVQLTPKRERSRSIFEIQNQIRQIGRQIPGATVRPSIRSPLPGGGGSGRLGLDVIGPELDTLLQIVAQIKTVASEVPGLTDVDDNSQAAIPELQIVLDGARMAQLNVTSQQVADALRTTLGGRVVGVLRPTGRSQQDITLVASEVDRADLTNLASIPVRGAPAGAGQPTPVVTLGQVATVRYGLGPVQIERIDRNRTISVGGTAVGRPLGDVARDLQEAISSVSLPPGYQVRAGRQVNQFNQALAALGFALLLAFILEYMLLVALYQSWFHPLALMVAVPLGLVGSLAGLWVTGNTINLFSMIGMIMAFGLVAKNGILLVDFANAMREQGLHRTQALAQAARIRLRPILMTSATMVFGMSPLALKLESGAESRAPMAVVVIGALLTSTALTVFVLPAVYTLFDDLEALVLRRRRAVAGPLPALEAAPALAYSAASPSGNGDAADGRAAGAGEPEAPPRVARPEREPA